MLERMLKHLQSLLPGHARSQLDAELRFHIEKQTEVMARAGVTDFLAPARHNKAMHAVTARTFFLTPILIVILTCASFAANGKTERIGSLTGADVSDALKQAVEDKGYRVTLDDGWIAEFWFAKQLKTVEQDVAGAVYPELTNAEFVGVVRFPQGMSDFRGQRIPPGMYTLRYQLLPQDGNHMGVAPNPDFLLASPVANDSRPEQSYVYKKLVMLSAKSTGTNHPAVIALESAGHAPTVVKTDHGTVVFTVTIPSVAGKTQKLGIVLKGAGTQ
jgi:hypothetical protein